MKLTFFSVKTKFKTNMLYFWLTSAVHQANRASMENMDQFSRFGRKRKFKKSKEKLKKKYQSEPDLSYDSSGSNSDPNAEQHRRRQSTSTSASNMSLSSSCWTKSAAFISVFLFFLYVILSIKSELGWMVLLNNNWKIFKKIW